MCSISRLSGFSALRDAHQTCSRAQYGHRIIRHLCACQKWHLRALTASGKLSTAACSRHRRCAASVHALASTCQAVDFKIQCVALGLKCRPGTSALAALQSGKLGCVVFQFHLSFTPSEANKRHVEWCRSRLDSSIDMAVEFRSRAWFHPDAADTVVRFSLPADLLNVCTIPCC